MRNLQQYVDEYVAQLSGRNADDAWHSLVEAGPAALPHVIKAFDATSDARVRTRLVQVVSEYRSAEGVPFLAALLRDHDAELWKSALDGLVMVGDHGALDALGVAKTTATPEQREWIDEAVGQIIEAHR